MNTGKKGFTLLELVIVMLLGLFIVGIILGLFIVSQQLQTPGKSVSDVVEVARSGMAQLEWIFSRWGTGTPCNDPTGANTCTRIRACDISGNFSYPPPSTLCVTIRAGKPCGQIWFYANLRGMAIVNNIYRNEAHLLSCRLQSKDENGNHFCFQIMRYGRFLRDYEHPKKILFWRLNDLNHQNAECLSEEYLNTYKYNAESDRKVEALNGKLQNATGGLTNYLLLEGGDMLLNIPLLIHLYCSPPDKNGIIWLEMDEIFPKWDKEIPSYCSADIKAAQTYHIKIAPVTSFFPYLVFNSKNGIKEVNDTSSMSNPNSSNYLDVPEAAIKVEITFRSLKPLKGYKTLKMIRYFGR